MPSTVIKEVSYDDAKQILTIEFVSGARYNYHSVSKEVAAAFRNYREKGIYYNRYIKGKYHFTRIN